MVLQIIGITALAGILLISGFLVWLNSLGSSADFRIIAYEADATIKPDESTMEVQVNVTLQAQRQRERVSFALGLGAEVQVRAVSDPVSDERLAYSARSLAIPLVGEWPTVKIITVALPKAIRLSKELKLQLDYTLRPPRRAGRYFAGITIDEWEARTQPQDLAFPILMLTLRDLWAVVIRGNYEVLPTFNYKLTITAPKDWQAKLANEGKVEAELERDGQKVIQMASTKPASLPAFIAWKALDISTEENRLQEFEYLWKKVDELYPAFKLRGIDWGAVHEEFKPLFAEAKDREEHYQLLLGMLLRLKDTHVYLDYPGEPRLTMLGLRIEEIEGRAFVTHVEEGSEAAEAGIKRGMEVSTIDGQPIAERVRELMASIPGFTERWPKLEAYKRLTMGIPGTPISLELRNTGGEVMQVRLAFPQPKPEQIETRLIPTGSVWIDPPKIEFETLPSGFGYIKLPMKWFGFPEFEQQFEQALEELKDAPGLIIDLRETIGGTFSYRIAGRLIPKRTKFGYFVIRRDKETHKLSKRRPIWISPQGNWQYRKPLVLLVSGLCASASELFIMGLKESGRAVVIGTPTAGAIEEFLAIPLPSGAEAGIGYSIIYSPKGEPLEGKGIMPDILVEQTLADLRAGRDRALEKAVAVLQGLVK